MKHSPRYSLNQNRNLRALGCDGRLPAALDAIRSVAASDPDHARFANRVGFSRADGLRGHRLAGMSPAQLRRDQRLSREALALAVRYRRQIPNSTKMALGLTDQYDLFD